MSFLRACCLLAAAATGSTQAAGNDQPGSVLALEDAAYRVEVSRHNGAILRIRDKLGGLELLQEPRLADNFRFTLPLRGPTAWQSTEANYILGKDQRLSAYEVRRDQMILKWNAPLTSVFGKPYDVGATMTIRLTGPAVRFDFRIANRTSLEIGEVFAPILGGCLGLGGSDADRRQTEMILPAGAGLQRHKIFHTFSNMSWLGIFGPEQYYSYPDVLSMPWIELYQPARKRAVYFAAHDPVARYKLVHLEMSPGISGPREEGNWPRPDQSRGLPVGVKISLVHMPYQPAGTAFDASPVVIAAHDGGWETAAGIYGQWFSSQFDLRPSRQQWMAASFAAQECRRVAFKELPSLAKAAAGYGVGELLLTDWKIGGHADGTPRFEPDPTLGSREELAAAIRQCHDLGVKLTLLVNLQPVSRKHEWYQSQLHRFASRDRWGVVATQMGWGSAVTLADTFASGERRVWLGAGSPDMRRILVGQVRELAQSGVDGILVQDFFARPLDFNAESGKTPDRASWEGGLECLQEIIDAGSSIRPGFSVAADMAWDRLLTLTQSPSIEGTAPSALKTALPFCRPICVVAEPDDFRSVNDAVLLGGRIRLTADPHALGGAEMQALATYIKAIAQVREALRPTLLEGEPSAAAASKVRGNVRHRVFRNPQSGLRSIVLVNDTANPVEVEPGSSELSARRPLAVWQPAAGSAQCTLPARLTIPGDQCAVVTEEAALERLDKIARWTPPGGTRRQRVVVEFRSPGDLEGWALQGEAFSVCSIPPLFRKCSLNSLAKAGESATGVATSPPVAIGAEFDRMEIVFHGGRSAGTGHGLSLALRAIDAATGRVLVELPPPGTHVLTTQTVPLIALRGKTVRFQLIDENTAGSYAWIGLRRITLVDSKR